MPFKLTRDEIKARDMILVALKAAHTKLEDEIIAYNEKLADMVEAVVDAKDKYNEVLDDARSFAQDVAAQADSDLSERSERWLEGDRGQAANSWKDHWEELGFGLDEIDIEFPEEIELLDTDHIENLEEAPQSADEA
jgi:hypothetical protein